jgi:hypothetical protein
MSAATIPLMVQPPKLENPIDNYSRLLSLRALQTQTQQQQQLAPMILQQHQLQLQAAQREADANSKAAQYWQDAQNEANAPQAQTQATPPAPAPSTTPAAAQTQPLSSLAASDGSPAWQYQIPTDPNASPSWTAAPPPAQGPPIATAAVPQNPAPSTPSPSRIAGPAPTAEDLFQQKMASAGFGMEGSRILQQRALAQRSQLETREMQRNENDQTQGAKLWNDFKGDPLQMRVHAGEYGISPQGVQQMNLNMFKMEQAQYQLNKEQADAGLARNNLQANNYQQIAGRATALQKRPEDESPEGRAANWPLMLQGFQRDGLIDSAHAAALLKAYPNGYPGADELQHFINTYSYRSGIAKGAAAISAQAKADSDRKTETFTSLVGGAQGGPQAFQKALADNHVDPSSVPAQFDATGKPIPGAIDKLRQMGLTINQQQTAQNAANTLTQRKDYQNSELGLRGRQVAVEEERLKNSAAEEKNQTYGAMGRVWNDTIAAMKGRGVDPANVTPQDAINFLKDSGNWEDKPAINDRRPKLMDAFAKSRQADLNAAYRAAATTNAVNKANQDEDYNNFLGGKAGLGQPGQPGAPGTSKPAPLPPPKRVGPPVAPKAPPPATATAKPFPRAKLADFAAANKMAPADAEAALRSAGYTIQ